MGLQYCINYKVEKAQYAMYVKPVKMPNVQDARSQIIAPLLVTPV